MRKKIVNIIFIYFIFICAINAKNLDGYFSNLYIKKFKVRDIILIVINENSMASQSNETDTSRNIDINGSALLTPIQPNDVNYSGKIGFKSGNKGSGAAKQSGLIKTVISCVITEIKENGILVIEGEKEIEMNSNTQKIYLKGEINQNDITPENYIDSAKIANLKIKYNGEGILGNKSRQGILTQILDWLGIL